MTAADQAPAPWTEAQWEAITTSGCNLLVSAAAGSGKTAVLVERIIHHLTGQERLDLDKLLVVTFTEAAAAEMRQRIREALEKELKKRPEDFHLQKQLVLLNMASISTLHGFCLNIIRRHFYRLGLDPALKVADETETTLLKQEVLEELLEQKYAAAEPDFTRLVEVFGGRGDEGLKVQILKIYKFTRSQPWPEEWLKKTVQYFNLPNGSSMEEIVWYKMLLKLMDLELGKVLWDLKEAYRVAGLPGGPGEYRENLVEELEKINEFKEMLRQFPWDILREKWLETTNFNNLKKVSAGTVDPKLKEKAKKLRDQAKKILREDLSIYFNRPLQDLIEDLGKYKPVAQGLNQLVLEFGEAYQKAKRITARVDFADLEHYSFQLLAAQESLPGQLIPSEIALELRKQFAEVLVDEYQDINEIQDAILYLVSRQGEKNPNLFMVGDVKQSIYRFRLANPYLFLDKYQKYCREQGCSERKITLAANFRSRKPVIDGVNYLFRQILTPEVGELTYDQDSELVYQAGYRPQEGIKESPVEIHLIERTNKEKEDFDREEESETEGEDWTALEKEARLIAWRIKELVGSSQETGSFMVWDKKLEAYRPVSYRDIVVLLRSTKERANTFIEIFHEHDLPSYAELGTGYFQATEITVMLSILKVIDNPRQDIPLVAVLRSPLVGLTACELAEIRICKESGDYYEALLAARNKSSKLELTAKLNKFLRQLHSWRTAGRRSPLSRLIWTIYQDTGYLDYAGAMPGGNQRQANLWALYDRARQFDRFARHGLFRFLRFIEKLQEKDEDLGSARALGENENVVRIMSIHKSKGLEFPVVFLADLGKEFNLKDLSGDLLLHQDLGYGAMFIDPSLRLKYPTLAFWTVYGAVRSACLAEELRILYVALTRARERLILVGSARDLAEKYDQWLDYLNYHQKVLPDAVLASAKSYLDWIGPAVIRQKNGIFHDDPSQWQIKLWGTEAGQELPQWVEVKSLNNQVPWAEIARLEVPDADPDPLLQQEINRRLTWEYPLVELTGKAAKITATEFKNLNREVLEKDAEAIALYKPQVPARPKFLQEMKGLTAAEIGTAMHLVMQHLELQKNLDTQEVKKQIEIMVDREFLAPEQAQVVGLEAFVNFFRGPLGRKMQEACNLVQREIPFTLALPVGEIYPELGENRNFQDKVLVQGIIDCLIPEEDGLIIIDYKTDRIREEQLETSAAKYQSQLDLYTKAVETIYRRPVKEKYLYFFYLGQEVRVK